jgi:hypothetical protein
MRFNRVTARLVLAVLATAVFGAAASSAATAATAHSYCGWLVPANSACGHVAEGFTLIQN